MRIAQITIATLALASSARAMVIDSQPNGFEIKETANIAAPPAKVWQALGQIGSWWKSEHTYSGDAKNLSLELEPGGCFCEHLPVGGVRHLQVVFVRPTETLRLAGALGPLQGTGAEGHMTLTLKAASAGHTAFTLTYDVGGYAKGGLANWAKPVDDVLGDQVVRLKRYAETGSPD